MIRRLAVIALACALATGVAPSPAAAVAAAVSKGHNGWYWPTGTDDVGTGSGWLDLRAGPQWHLAKDIRASVGAPCYALTDGVVYAAYDHLDGYGGAMIVLYRNESGQYFKALYGHIKSIRYYKGAKVRAGAVIAYINATSPPHLHFGIHPGSGLPTDPQHNPFRGHTYVKGAYYGWTDPIAYLNAHTPYVPPKPVTLASPVLPSTVPAGRILNVSATMTPVHDYSTGMLRLERWRLAGRTWEMAGSDPMRPRRKGAVARARILLPAGTWRLRTRFAGDKDHLPGVSGWVTVIAR